MEKLALQKKSKVCPFIQFPEGGRIGPTEGPSSVKPQQGQCMEIQEEGRNWVPLRVAVPRVHTAPVPQPEPSQLEDVGRTTQRTEKGVGIVMEEDIA